jgi:hypothetical protein
VRQLGARLFERGRDGVRLTPVGTALLPHARLVLADGSADVAFVWLPVPDPAASAG